MFDYFERKKFEEMQDFLENPNLENAKYLREVGYLKAQKVNNISNIFEKLSNPNISRKSTSAYYLTDMGKRFYETNFPDNKTNFPIFLDTSKIY